MAPEHLEQLGLLRAVAVGPPSDSSSATTLAPEVVEVVGRGEAGDAEAGDDGADALPGVVASEARCGSLTAPATHSA